LRARFPDIQLQVDANSSYDLSNWQDLLGLDDLALLLIEQPLFDDDIVEHSQIAPRFKTPICLDESIHSLRDTQAAMLLWERNDALDRLIINIKPPRVSGFDEAIAIAKVCRAAGVKTWIGGMLESAIGASHCLALATLSNIAYPSDIFPTSRFYQRDLTEFPMTHFLPGKFAASEKPGIGVVPHEAHLQSCVLERAVLNA